DLYASTLPLARLRYAVIGSFEPAGPYAMDFAGMGIITTASEFDDLDRHEPVFRQKLREWGLDSTAPIGTLIAAATPRELADVVAAHPAADFLVPERYREALAGDTAHDVRPALPDHFLLLSRQSVAGQKAAWSCEL